MTPPEERELLRRFRSLELSKAEWTHQAHLLVALASLRDNPPETVLSRLREDIQLLNLHHGVRTTPEGGYHETLTRFWLSRVWEELQTAGRQAPSEQVLALCGNSAEALLYYSKAHLFSWQARIDWAEPDLRSLAYSPQAWSDGTPPLFSLKEKRPPEFSPQPRED